MKKYFIISLLIFVSFQLWSQNYNYINRAEKLINKSRNLSKAMRLLNKAQNVDYGFCGNAWAEADWSIHYLKARIYYIQEKYELAIKELNSIDNCHLGGDCHSSDSLKLRVYQDLE